MVLATILFFVSFIILVMFKRKWNHTQNPTASEVGISLLSPNGNMSIPLQVFKTAIENFSEENLLGKAILALFTKDSCLMEQIL